MIDHVNTGERPAARGSLLPCSQLPVRPWFLAPPLRVVSDPTAEMLTMHSIQTADAYKSLVDDGVLAGESWRGEPEFQEAYSWMLRQMAHRDIPGPRDRMTWLYVSTTRRELRWNARRARGEILLTVRVPRERLLISDLADWHAVLNRYLHVPLEPGDSEATWEERWTALDAEFSARADPYESLPLEQWPAGLRAELETSWEAIFDPATWAESRTLQATIRELHAEDVTRAVKIR